MNNKKMPLSIKVFVALIIGVVIGLFCTTNTVALAFLTEYIKPIGDIFLNLLKFVVVPIVLISIICGIISLSDTKKVWFIGIRTIVFYLVTTFIALIIGTVIALLFKKGFVLLDTTDITYEANEAKNFIKVIADMFPSNFVAPLLNASMLQVIVMAIFIGFAIILCGEKAKAFSDFLVSANEVFIKIMSIIIEFSPIGVVCLIAPVVAENGPKIIGSLALVIGIAYLGYIIHIFFAYGIMLKLFANKNIFDFIKGLGPAMIMAFSSASSVGTLPLNMDCTKKMGARDDIVSFVLPLGATINMDGTAIYQAVCTIFIATCYGITLTPMQLLTVIVTATVASIGTAGVPGAGVVMLAMVLQSVGLPVEGIALVLGVDRIFDMGRTVVNITGDSACAICISSMTKDNEKGIHIKPEAKTDNANKTSKTSKASKKTVKKVTKEVEKV